MATYISQALYMQCLCRDRFSSHQFRLSCCAPPFKLNVRPAMHRSTSFLLCAVTSIRSFDSLPPCQAIKASPRKTGVVILGGGVAKHHVNNANLFRNGADFAVYINTAQEFDGSDSGARPDEAVSWGKIRMDAKPVKVHGDATILFPLLVSQTFAKRVGSRST